MYDGRELWGRVEKELGGVRAGVEPEKLDNEERKGMSG